MYGLNAVPATKVALVVTKVALIIVEAVLVVARVLEQRSGNFRIESSHSQAGCTT